MGTGNAVKASSRGSPGTWCAFATTPTPFIFLLALSTKGERERETKLRYLCKYAISELIDRTKRHPIFPIFFRSSLDYLSFLILPLIQSIRQSSFKIFSLKYSTFLLQHFYPFRITILEFFETLIFRYILKLFKDRSTCDIF